MLLAERRRNTTSTKTARRSASSTASLQLLQARSPAPSRYALPTWMAPEQVRFLPVTDRAADSAPSRPRSSKRRHGLPRQVDYRNRSAARSATRRWRRSWWSSVTATPGERHRFPAPPHGRRPRRDEHGRVLRASSSKVVDNKEEVNLTQFCIIQYVRPSCDQGGSFRTLIST